MRLLQSIEDVSTIPLSNRDDIVVTTVVGADGKQHALSLYGHMFWDFRPYFPHAARGMTEKIIDWSKTPVEWVPCLKEAVSLLMTRIPEGCVRLDPAGIPKRHIIMNAFAKWAVSRGIHNFSEVTEFSLSAYLQELAYNGAQDRTVNQHRSTLLRYALVSENSISGVPRHAISSLHKYIPISDQKAREKRTKCIPVSEARDVFQSALAVIEQADYVLDLRDKIESSWARKMLTMTRKQWGDRYKRVLVVQAGFKDALEYESALVDIRTACYIVLAMTTGCRVHELGDIRTGCVYQQTIQGNTYWWLKSWTRKIGEKPTRWLAPPIAKKVSVILERHSEPLRRKIKLQIAEAQGLYGNEYLPQEQRALVAMKLLELRRNVNRLFLSESINGITSTDTKSHNKQIQSFLKRAKLRLSLVVNTHNFRRTYAVFITHLNKGASVDLVVLRDHFKHGNIQMTEWYASLSQADHQLIELLGEESSIFDRDVVAHWLEPDTPLAGGFGGRVKRWAGQYHTPTFYKNHSQMIDCISEGLDLRSTGHSWCISGASGCGGKGLFEPSSCGSCEHGLIDDTQTAVWEGIRGQHTELLNRKDIGPGGHARVVAALKAAEDILEKLIPLGGRL